MKRTWLILDSNYLCYRAFYAMGGLSFGDVRTGVVYGFVKDVINFQESFRTDDVVFCFDYGKGLRKQDFSGYKEKRHTKELTEEEIVLLRSFKQQVSLLRTDYLPRLGFANVFYQRGYESDDVIASVVNHLPKGDEGVIISADADLYQLLTPDVVFHNPQTRKTVSYSSFVTEWGIPPKDWWKVKALAGCATDEVPGIPGVGEKTAIKFLTKQLKPTAKTYQAIVSPEGIATRKRNTKLVRLPYPGVQDWVPQVDTATGEDMERGWAELVDELGFKSLKGKRLRPGRTRKGFNLNGK